MKVWWYPPSDRSCIAEPAYPAGQRIGRYASLNGVSLTTPMVNGFQFALMRWYGQLQQAIRLLPVDLNPPLIGCRCGRARERSTELRTGIGEQGERGLKRVSGRPLIFAVLVVNICVQQ